MNTVKMKLPVITKSDGWYHSEGHVEVAYESSDLTEAVAGAKEQANKVLSGLAAEALAVTSLDEVQQLIRKAKDRLEETERKQKNAQRHFEALMTFLGKFGIDGTIYRHELRISAQPILEAVADDDDHDDDDDDDDA